MYEWKLIIEDWFNKQSKFEKLFLLGEIHFKMTNFGKSYEIFKNALKVIPKNDSQKRIIVNLKIAATLERIGTKEFKEKAKIILNGVRDESISIKYFAGLGEYYYRMGILTSIHSRDWDLGLKYFTEAIRFKNLQRPKDFDGIAKSNLQLGTIYCHKAKEQANQEYYLESLKFCRKSLRYRISVGDLKGQGNCSFGIGNVYRRSGKFNLAEKWYKKFKEISQLLGDNGMLGDSTLSLSKVYLNRGEIYKNSGDISNAKVQYLMAQSEINECYHYRRNFAKKSSQYLNYEKQRKLVLNALNVVRRSTFLKIKN